MFKSNHFSQGCIPTWPTSLSGLTGYSEATTPGFAAAIAHADRLAAQMFSGAAPPPPPQQQQQQHAVAAPL